jgi:hypothetical protein
MGDHAEFKDHIEMQAYAERSGLSRYHRWAVFGVDHPGRT